LVGATGLEAYDAAHGPVAGGTRRKALDKTTCTTLTTTTARLDHAVTTVPRVLPYSAENQNDHPTNTTPAAAEGARSHSRATTRPLQSLVRSAHSRTHSRSHSDTHSPTHLGDLVLPLLLQQVVLKHLCLLAHAYGSALLQRSHPLALLERKGLEVEVFLSLVP
jgi:hypothetical protein